MPKEEKMRIDKLRKYLKTNYHFGAVKKGLRYKQKTVKHVLVVIRKHHNKNS